MMGREMIPILKLHQVHRCDVTRRDWFATVRSEDNHHAGCTKQDWLIKEDEKAKRAEWHKNNGNEKVKRAEGREINEDGNVQKI